MMASALTSRHVTLGFFSAAAPGILSCWKMRSEESILQLMSSALAYLAPWEIERPACAEYLHVSM